MMFFQLLPSQYIKCLKIVFETNYFHIVLLECYSTIQFGNQFDFLHNENVKDKIETNILKNIHIFSAIYDKEVLQ